VHYLVNGVIFSLFYMFVQCTNHTNKKKKKADMDIAYLLYLLNIP
jgi:hypothetical protein